MRCVAWFGVLVMLLVPEGARGQMVPGQGYRNLSGTVTDGHEPLKGAVVQVQNTSMKSVSSYITDRNGHYSFQRLEAGSDYSFWATFRGKKSRTKSLSMFNDKKASVVNLVVRLH